MLPPTKPAAWMLLVVGFIFGAALNAQASSPNSSTPEKKPVEPTKAALPAAKKIPCLDCHEGPVVSSILNTKHAMMADKRTPFAQDACQTCHGASQEHMDSGGEQVPSTKFGAKSKVPVAEQNKVCLTCHESGARMEWKGSAHETAEIACTTCHTLHANQDKTLGKKTQSDVCYSCHKTQRAQIHRSSAHPIKNGKMSCSGCHNPHGGTGPKLLNKSTLNETCYTCHAEKRGPFLWEHQPVQEDCSICHVPHGSNHAPLLNAKGPWLCQQCHQEEFHPSLKYNGTGIPPNQQEDCLACHKGQVRPAAGGAHDDPISADVGTCSAPDGCHVNSEISHGGRVTPNMLGKNCLNCHSQIHGSNHPSGVKLMR